MAEVKRSLPIGIQSFEKLIEADFLYIDKTKYIWDLLRPSKQAIAQIKEKGYAAPYKETSTGGTKKSILAVGASFDEEKRTIKDWCTEELF